MSWREGASGRGLPWGGALGFGSGLRRLAFGADALQQDGGGFVVGVLGHKLAGESLFEDALAEAVGPFEAGVHGGLGLLDDGHLALDLGDDAVLFG